MALKRPNRMMSTFSMASMTDIIFLLLIFFMVTSTYIFPTALEVNLPQSTQQTSMKPSIRIYIDQYGQLYTVKGDDTPQPIAANELASWLRLAKESEEETPTVALYADESVPYGSIVEILNIGAGVDVKMVLATKPAPVTDETVYYGSDEYQITPETTAD